MNNIIFRLLALLLHMLVNVTIIVYLTNFDLTRTWFGFIGFIVAAFLLLFLFIRHIISFINFIKSRP